MITRTRILAFFLLFLLLSFKASEIAQADTPKHCLWRVNTQHNTVYLLGSIHMLREDNYPLSPVMEEAFRQAEADSPGQGAPKVALAPRPAVKPMLLLPVYPTRAK